MISKIETAGNLESLQEILRRRARELAREPEKEDAAEQLQLVVFTLATEEYAVEARFVEEVFSLEAITTLPGAPNFIAGIVNFRGTMLTLVNIKKFFDLPDSGITDVHKVVSIRSKDMKVGLLADRLAGVMAIDPLHLQKSLPTLNGIRADYLKGIHAGSLIVLEVEKLLADERLIVDQTVTK